MKYVVVLGDGMADEPSEELQGGTPLACAKTPEMDDMAKKGEIGMVRTIPAGMSPGSDTANLSVLGYDPKKYYTGRSPLEALSIGAQMKDTDVAIRCNLVTLSDEAVPYEQRTILDHSAGEISTEAAAVLLMDTVRELEKEDWFGQFRFFVGTSYRHCMLWDCGKTVELTPPHDVLGQKIGAYLPKEALLRKIQEKSCEILSRHPLNRERKSQGLATADSFWFWGAGTKPALTSFEERFHKKGMMVSAVDLLKGLAIGAGMDIVQIEGANGGLDTNYEGKAQAAVDALVKDGYDFAYIHLEGPDEMGHQGSLERKIRAIEYLDQRIIAPVRKNLEEAGLDYRMLVLPDHPTPVRLRTHTADPVPYLLYDSTCLQKHDWHYCEAESRKSGNFIEQGCELLPKLFAKEKA